MKRRSITALAAALMAVCLLAACVAGQLPSPGTGSTGESTVSLQSTGTAPVQTEAVPTTTEAPETAAPTEAHVPYPTGPLVEDACLESYEKDSETFLYNLPRVNLDSPEIAALNQRITDSFLPDIKESCSMLEAGEEPELGEVTYQWTIRGDVLSLVIHIEHRLHWGWHWSVFNISVSQGRLLLDREVVEAAGLTREEYRRRAKEAIAARFLETASWDDEGDFTLEQFARSVADFNIDNAQPFFDETGKLMIRCVIYSIAGADSYEYCLGLEDYELPEDLGLFADRMESPDRSGLYPDVPEPWGSFLRKNGYWTQYGARENAKGYALPDIDGDGNPELAILDQSSPRVDIFSYDPATERYAWIGYLSGKELYASPDRQALVAVRHYSGHSEVDYDAGRLQDGSFAEIVEFSYEEESDEIRIHFDFDLTEEECRTWMENLIPVEFLPLEKD